ncbi:hypothetical protein GBF38_010473 [Nibea albiflora]|uniref:Uncharacterized protein n=1 Tax=Nibea albiflora TaxID=240163 RepID=A0ACB7F484_NIBAL|nr:hypothetical protein GBF38_010473 [Nibea albiflora]
MRGIKQVLVEHVKNTNMTEDGITIDGITGEELVQTLSSIIEDTDAVAFDVANYIWSNKEEFGMNIDGSPKPEAQSSSTKCWNVVANKIKIFFARKFAKEAILSFLANLRQILDCFSKKPTLDVLIPAADSVVQDMVPAENPDECAYKKMSICLHNGKHMISQRLGNLIIGNIKPDDESNRSIRLKMHTEVHKFLDQMCSWLNRQTQQDAQTNDSVQVSLDRIRAVLDLPKPPEVTVTPVVSAPPSVTAEPHVSDEANSASPIAELRPPSVTAEPRVSDEANAASPIAELRPSSVTAKPRVSDEVNAASPIAELRPPSVTAKPRVSDEANAASPIAELRPPSVTAKPRVSDEANAASPIAELRPPSVTAKPRVSDEANAASPIAELRPPSVTAKPRVSDEANTASPIAELRPPSITAEQRVSEVSEDNSVTPVCDRPKFESVTPRVTAEPALTDRTQPREHAELFYRIMAAAVVHQCLKNTKIPVSTEENKRIISALTVMLRTSCEGFEFVRPKKGHKIKKIAKAVHKDLCTTLGSKGYVQTNLLSGDTDVYECVMESLKRQLVKPKKTGIKKVFTSLFNTVTKPFKALPGSE